MTHFGQLLKSARKRAMLTQQGLAMKVGIHHSYISKMEKEDYLPSFDVAVELADALGMSDDEGFLFAARPLKGFKLVKVEDYKEVEEEHEQGSGITTYSAGSPGLSIRRSLPSSTTGGKVDRLIASGRFSEAEEEEVEAAIIELINRLISFKETQRKMQGED